MGCSWWGGVGWVGMGCSVGGKGDRMGRDGV